jgi:hypothetical protein
MARLTLLHGVGHGDLISQVHIIIVYVDCLALSISSDIWLVWLVNETWHGIRAEVLCSNLSVHNLLKIAGSPPFYPLLSHM